MSTPYLSSSCPLQAAGHVAAPFNLLTVNSHTTADLCGLGVVMHEGQSGTWSVYMQHYGRVLFTPLDILSCECDG
jgi:hypothetical protein